jgi:hypothetical protein
MLHLTVYKVTARLSSVNAALLSDKSISKAQIIIRSGDVLASGSLFVVNKLPLSEKLHHIHTHFPMTGTHFSH